MRAHDKNLKNGVFWFFVWSIYIAIYQLIKKTREDVLVAIPGEIIPVRGRPPLCYIAETAEALGRVPGRPLSEVVIENRGER